jgi:hypothetical protein
MREASEAENRAAEYAISRMREWFPVILGR